MDARWSPCAKRPLLSAGRKTIGSSELMCGWSGTSSPVKLALMVCFGLSILLVPGISLTFTSTLRLRLFEPSLIAVREKNSEALRSHPDETLEGLLLPPAVFNDTRCSSRSQEYSIRTPSRYKPSSYLISKLREYERRHWKCAQEVIKFSPASNATEQDFGGCQFIVWIASSGLGNRIMTLTSAFVYALLTDRVLLIDRSSNTDELFCEPFPYTSWLLPQALSQWTTELRKESSCRFGSLARNGTFTSLHNGYAYLNLMHDYDRDDKRFFCARYQDYVRGFPWLFLKSDQYFAPGLHFVSDFHVELDKLFPEREVLFHHIVRYLIHPSDSVWSMILPFFSTKLASAQRKVGLQIRVIESETKSSTISDLVFSCVLDNKLLPNVPLRSQDHIHDAPRTNSTSVLIASLRGIFYENIRGFYLNHTTADGHYVGVYTASHEEWQTLNSFDQDKKALADMYLLSFSDTLVTSAWSTFGYVAQGISGVTPWILTRIQSTATAAEVIRQQGQCFHGVSIEPCFHSPPSLDCDNNDWAHNSGKVLPYIQHCEDISWGIKIMENGTLN